MGLLRSWPPITQVDSPDCFTCCSCPIDQRMSHTKERLSEFQRPFSIKSKNLKTVDGRESGWTPGVGDGQGGLACWDSWGRKELDTTERLNWTELMKKCLRYWSQPRENRVSVHVSSLLHTLVENLRTNCHPFSWGQKWAENQATCPTASGKWYTVPS